MPTESEQEKPCEGRKHYWPLMRNDGDTCNCGSFYLYDDKDGGTVVEETPADNEDA